MQQSQQITPLFEIINGFWKTQVLFVMIDLEIFTIVDNCPKSINELSTILEIGARELESLMNAAVSLELLQKDGSHYSNSAIAKTYLVKGQPEYFGGFARLYGGRLYHLWGHLNEMVRSGNTVGKEFLKHVRQDESRALEFSESLFRNSEAPANVIASEVDFSSYHTLLDIGAGSGVYGITIAKQNPNLQLIALDLPAVVNVTEQFAERHGVAERVQVIGGDMLETPLPVCDVAIIANALHAISVHKVRDMLCKIFERLPIGGTLIVVERRLNEQKTAPQQSTFFGLMLMLINEEGELLTERGYLNMMIEVGFEKTQTIALPNDFVGFVAKKEARQQQSGEVSHE